MFISEMIGEKNVLIKFLAVNVTQPIQYFFAPFYAKRRLTEVSETSDVFLLVTTKNTKKKVKL